MFVLAATPLSVKSWLTMCTQWVLWPGPSSCYPGTQHTAKRVCVSFYITGCRCIYLHFYVQLMLSSKLIDIVYRCTFSINIYTLQIFFSFIHLDLHLFLFLYLDIMQKCVCMCVLASSCIILSFAQHAFTCVINVLYYVMISCDYVCAMCPFMWGVRCCVVTLHIYIMGRKYNQIRQIVLRRKQSHVTSFHYARGCSCAQNPYKSYPELCCHEHSKEQHLHRKGKRALPRRQWP